jgi:hypothetical protein
VACVGPIARGANGNLLGRVVFTSLHDLDPARRSMNQAGWQQRG